MSILREMGDQRTPQSAPVPGKNMTQNAAGGFAFSIDDWARLDRFLILGVDTGTYYVSARTLATENVDLIDRCIKADARRVVDAIVAVSDEGRAPNNDPALFALARVAAKADDAGRKYALDNLGKVARIGTHLFHFAQFADNQRGWGRGLRRAVADWYESKDPDQLAYQAVKYRQRDGWTHRDLLRLAHPGGHNGAVYDFICGRDVPVDAPRIIDGFQRVQSASPAEAAKLVAEYKLPWETLTSEQLKDRAVWDALLGAGSLPLGALVRNLGVMTARGVLDSQAAVDLVTRRLGDVDEIRRARLHPIAFLKALAQYRTGQSRGGVSWVPVSKVADALDAGFYTAFQTIDPSNKRTLIGLDVSGSMTYCTAAAMNLNAMEIATAMAMVTVATEPSVTTMAFSHQFVPVDVSPRRRLDDNIDSLRRIGFGGTDCSLPMTWATEKKVEVDTFVVYTDNETWAGRVHPFIALQGYRQKMGIDARLVVVGVTATDISIADPTDGGMVDVVGFDTSTPSVIADFSARRF